jgi:Asp-tRNA(Asn)/Glu-tRNA(Gln) amidotransferase A subunit family amidase
MSLASLRQQLLAGETTPAAILEHLAGEIAARDSQTGAYLSTISTPRSPRPPKPIFRCRSAASRSPSRTT